MSGALKDLWLPEVEAEYFALLKKGRDVAFDVGNQFRVFERILERGVDRNWQPIARVKSADVYVAYAGRVLMFLAVSGSRAAIVKWTTLGTPHEESMAEREAKDRTARCFS